METVRLSIEVRGTNAAELVSEAHRAARRFAGDREYRLHGMVEAKPEVVQAGGDVALYSADCMVLVW